MVEEQFRFQDPVRPRGEADRTANPLVADCFGNLIILSDDGDGLFDVGFVRQTRFSFDQGQSGYVAA